MTYIGEKVFTKSSNFTSIDFVENSEMKSFGSFAFYDTPIENLSIPSKLESSDLVSNLTNIKKK